VGYRADVQQLGPEAGAADAGQPQQPFAGPNGEFPVLQHSNGSFVECGGELATFARLLDADRAAEIAAAVAAERKAIQARG
jgi:hypothetical protein